MATQREIRKRIQSVTSTKKITRTMEMVSTAKMKKMQDRLRASMPYAENLNKIIKHLKDTGLASVYDILMQEQSEARKAMILLITGNRGLCGGFNTVLIDNALKLKKKLEIDEGKEVLLYVIGKKAISNLTFMGIPLYRSMPNFEDKLTFADASDLGDELIAHFTSGEVDEVHVCYTKVMSAASQKPATVKLLPITSADEDIDSTGYGIYSNYIFEPNPYKILGSILPLFIKVQLYLYQLESSFSEQFARRVAMKNATDAATDMIKDLTIRYNRARQEKITKEISEIVGGAAALS